MGKRSNPTLDYLVYLAVRIVVAIVQALPVRVAVAVADGLGLVGYLVDGRHRRVALENVRLAYPECRDERQRRRLVLRVYRHFARVVVEIACIPRKVRPTNWKRYVRLDNCGAAVGACLDDRPTLFVTGHFGNWEMAGFLFSAVGLKSHAIARDLDNRYLHDFLLRFREYNGQTILSKKGDWDRIQAVLRDGGVLCTVGDQSAGPRGYFVDFFGRPASTHKAIALLAMEFHARVIVGCAYRDRPDFHYAVHCAGILDPRDYADRPDGAMALTADLTALIEANIRRAPDQYLWLHNRWKHAPPLKRRARAAA